MQSPLATVGSQLIRRKAPLRPTANMEETHVSLTLVSDHRAVRGHHLKVHHARAFAPHMDNHPGHHRVGSRRRRNPPALPLEKRTISSSGPDFLHTRGHSDSLHLQPPQYPPTRALSVDSDGRAKSAVGPYCPVGELSSPSSGVGCHSL